MLRTLFALALFAASLLVLLPAPTLPLWKLTIIVTEYGHWLAALALALLLISGHGGGRQGRGAPRLASLALAAAVPLLLANSVAAASRRFEWEALFTEAFGAPSPAGRAAAHEADRAFLWGPLWSRNKIKIISPESLPYAERPTGRLFLDFYRSGRAGPSPCVVVVHGGGWESGDARQLPELNSELAARGYAVAAVTYRLAPVSKWPAPKEDVLAAIAFLKAKAKELGLDPTKFVLLGRSAGAQIAQVAAYEKSPSPVRALVSMYGPADMNLAYKYAEEDDILKSPALIRNYMGGPPEALPAVYRSASGLEFVSPASPPTLIVHGRRDELVWYEQSRRLSERLGAKGVPHFLMSLDFATHGFDYAQRGPSGQLFRAALWRFLAKFVQDPLPLE
jgi:acetyl esterase/lipase